MKELIELQENSGRQFSELMSKINEQKEYLTKEIEALIETKQELELELKNLVDEIKDEILPFVTTWMDLQSITLATKLQNARGSCLKIVKGKPYQVEWGRPCHWISFVSFVTEECSTPVYLKYQLSGPRTKNVSAR
ncbi:uncharacterized protein RBU33_016232 isoform 2-T6 [Hipposideros larvatus]